MSFEDVTINDFMAPTADTLLDTSAAIDSIADFVEVTKRIAVATVPIPPENEFEIEALRVSYPNAERSFRLEIKDLTAGALVRVGESNISPEMTDYLLGRLASLMAVDGLQHFAHSFEQVRDALLAKDPSPAVLEMIGPGSNVPTALLSVEGLSHVLENGHTIECELMYGNSEYVYRNGLKPVPERSTITVGAPLWQDEGKRYNFAVLPHAQGLRTKDIWLIEHDVASLPADEAEEMLKFNPAGAAEGAYTPTDGSLSRFAAILRATHRSLEREFGPLDQ